MAGDWIKMRCNLADDPAVIGMARRTGLDEDTIVGKLHRLWSWADQHTIDGNAASVTKTWLDRYTCVTGFADAMANEGWLEVTDDGLTFPRFDRHNGQTAKRRALTSRRVHKNRHQKCNAPSVTREEKRREEKSKKDPLTPKGDGAFGAFWQSVHLKTGKEAARRAHAKAVERVAVERGTFAADAAAYILERMQAFAGTPRANPPDRTAIHPATWLNQGCYDDDPATWQGGGNSQPEPDGKVWHDFE